MADDAAPAPADASDAGPSCPLPGRYGSPTCEACLRATCCDEITACVANAACAELQTCALDCLKQETDAGGCKRQCEQSHPDGNTQWQKVYTCWFDDPPMGCLVECT